MLTERKVLVGNTETTSNGIQDGVRQLTTIDLKTNHQRSFYEYKMKVIEDSFYGEDKNKEMVLKNSFLMRIEEDTIRREKDMAVLELMGLSNQLQILVTIGVVANLDEALSFNRIDLDLYDWLKTNASIKLADDSKNKSAIVFNYLGLTHVISQDLVKSFNGAMRKVQEYSKLLRKFKEGGVVVSLGDHPLTLDRTLRDSMLVTIKLYDVTGERNLIRHITSYIDSLVTHYGLQVAYLRSSFNSLKVDFFITPENMRKVYRYLAVDNSLTDCSGVLHSTDDERHFLSYVKLTMKDVATGEKTVERLYMYV